MKPLFTGLVVFILTGLLAHAQPCQLPSPTYSNALVCGWPKHQMLILTLSDKETGDLVSHETMTVMLPRSASFAGGVYTLRYCLIIECVNRKYRVTLSQFAVQENGSLRAMLIETYCQKADKDRQYFSIALDKQANEILVSLQETVKAYASF